MLVTIVVAVGPGGVIGREGGLPWRLPSDLKRFKALTMGHTLLMGRRTWESIGRALPGRHTVVVSGSDLALPPGVDQAPSLEAALAMARARGESEAFVVGGAALYAAALPLAGRAVVTYVQGGASGDVFFPEVDWSTWAVASREDVAAGAGDDCGFEVVDYRRSSGQL